MNGLTIIGRFLDTFLRYIDSGLGLLQGEVAFLTATLIVTDMTIDGLHWAMSHATGQRVGVIPKLLRTALYIGAFDYIIGNINWLTSSSSGIVSSARQPTIAPATMRRQAKSPPAVVAVVDAIPVKKLYMGAPTTMTSAARKSPRICSLRAICCLSVSFRASTP